MIVPSGYEAMTDDELLAAYAAMGFSEATARAYLGVLRMEPDPSRPVD